MNLLQRVSTRMRSAYKALTSMELARLIEQQMTSAADVGIPVTPLTALGVPAVFACVRVLSEDIASLPIGMFERTATGRAPVTNHWLADLLDTPNEWQTGFEFRELQQAKMELDGEFIGIKTVVRGETREIIPTAAWRWRIQLDEAVYRLRYFFTFPDGHESEVPSSSVYHVRGLSLDGIRGVSPIRFQRETIAFGIALRRYGVNVFKNGAVIGGVIEHDGILSDPAYERLRSSFEEKYTGIGNAGKVVLLEEGAKFNQSSMTVEDAQYIDSNKLTRTEIAGIYRVPPPYIGDLDRATFSNIEQQATDYVQKGLLPRVRRVETRMALSLLSPADRARYYVRHNLDGLQRGDFTTRMQGYQTAVLTGWLSRAEVRTLEEMNPGPDSLNEYLVPSNEMLASVMLNQPPKTPPSTPPGKGNA